MSRMSEEAVLKGLAGGALLWVAFRGAWVLRVGAAVCGGSLLASAFRTAAARPEASPRLLTEPAAVEQGEEARVDQSSWESFPASDPPGY